MLYRLQGGKEEAFALYGAAFMFCCFFTTFLLLAILSPINPELAPGDPKVAGSRSSRMWCGVTVLRSGRWGGVTICLGMGDSQPGLWAAGSCLHILTRCFFHQIVCSATSMHVPYDILSPFITAISLLSWPCESLLIDSNTSAVPSGGCILMNFLLTQSYSCTPTGFREQGWCCEAEDIPHGAEVTVLSCPVLYYPAQHVIPMVGGCTVGTRLSPPPFICMVEMAQRRAAPSQAEWGSAHPALRCCIA